MEIIQRLRECPYLHLTLSPEAPPGAYGEGPKVAEELLREAGDMSASY